MAAAKTAACFFTSKTPYKADSSYKNITLQLRYSYENVLDKTFIKIRKLKPFRDKDFSFLCFLIYMP